MQHAMKMVFGVIVSCILLVTTAGATIQDNNTNQSTEFIRMQARVGSSDSTDAIVYNPAGTVWMEDGSFAAAHNQTLPKDYSHFFGGKQYETTTLTPFCPSLFYLKKTGNWSAFASTAIHGGGGSLTYENGTMYGKAMVGLVHKELAKEGVTDLDAALQKVTQAIEGFPEGLPENHPLLEKLKKQQATLMGAKGMRDLGVTLSTAETQLTQIYPGLTVGGAYRFGDRFSASLGMRVIKGKFGVSIGKGTLLDLQADATGFAPIVGLNYRPTDSLTFALRHEFKTPLTFSYDALEGNPVLVKMFSELMGGDEDEFQRDLASMTAFGFAWMVRPDLKIASDMTIAWHRDADQEGNEEEYSEGYEFAIGAEWFVNDTWTVSTGYSYCDSGSDMDTLLALQPKLNVHAIAGGFRFAPTENLGLQFGLSRYFYMDHTVHEDTPYEIEYKKDLLIFALGVDYRFD